MTDYHVNGACRLCEGRDLKTVLQLASTPLANEFLPAGKEHEQDGFPLYLARCQRCGHVQLPVVVDPQRLFGSYCYVSGTSPVFVDHFRRYAANLCTWLTPDDFVVELGSNDGTLLRFLQDAGMKVLGVDPAIEIAIGASERGITTLPFFFDSALAGGIIDTHGQASLVIANNVFAHADDLRDIAIGVKRLLKPGGLFVFEVQYLVDMLEGGLFDMIYHEHLSYHHVAPLVTFFTKLGMAVIGVEHVDTHGGSIRCVVAPVVRNVEKSVFDLMQHEREVVTEQAFSDLAASIRISARQLADALQAEDRAGRVVAGYGAPAKLTTLMHEFGLHRDDLAYIVDDSPLKRGRVTPGLHIPVVEGGAPWPDTFVVFAWNFADSIAAKLRGQGFTGKILVPLPKLREVA